MGKHLFIAEKPSVAKEFARVLKVNTSQKDGYLEGESVIVTWCVGHLVSMSYPESYDPRLKKWTFDTIPFFPKEYKYEVIPAVEKQFKIVSGLLNRSDVDRIYVCTDSGREGEYIYRLVDRMANVPDSKDKRRVWIDSQTEEEILRGIKEAKPLSEYDNLSASAYLRAKEDYLMGINFSRALSLKYGNLLKRELNSEKYSAIAVGRVMTCVLGIVVRREREIREFKKTPFYRVVSKFDAGFEFDGEFKADKDSNYFESPMLYKDNGFTTLEYAREFVEYVGGMPDAVTAKEENTENNTGKPEKLSETHNCENVKGIITSVEKKNEKKKAPLLFNLAEIQNTCSQAFKISPDETLKIIQELYEKKLVTYPRTDARVLSSAVAKEITKNIKGISALNEYKGYCENILNNNLAKGLTKTRYVNDSQITDHYAIIPTGQGLGNLNSLGALQRKVYDKIVRRFLSIFYPDAVYQKVAITVKVKTESFSSNFKALKEQGYLEIAGNPQDKNKNQKSDSSDNSEGENKEEEEVFDENLLSLVAALKKGSEIDVKSYTIKEGETTPPKRYNSGSLILTMEKAGQFIDDEELRAQIKGSGIGTSATRAEILNKLIKIEYLNLNKKTQIITPTLKGEMVYETVFSSVRSLLNAELTASWEKGLTQVSEGQIDDGLYMEKLEGYVGKWTNYIKDNNYSSYLIGRFRECEKYYKK
ncbi:MAG: type IA DNA topoisomerase [Lachnospiraceae bacterium]|nr:type IA DNA topoisomerase [Lachnospiraceae bacterium]